MHILLRFDDICPTMNYELFEKACKIMDSVGAKPLIGVIPECEDPELQIDDFRHDFWEYIKNLQQRGYTVAMHGYKHVYDSDKRGRINRGYKSEFAGHSFEEQLTKISKGKELLLSHGIETDIFFAPSHSYDINTLKALKVCGFHYMSDGCSRKPYLNHGIICLPARSFGFPNLKKDKYYTAIMHTHEWERPEKAVGYSRLVETCNRHASEIEPFSEYIKQPYGNSIIQKIDEKVYVFLKRAYIRLKKGS